MNTGIVGRIPRTMFLRHFTRAPESVGNWTQDRFLLGANKH